MMNKKTQKPRIKYIHPSARDKYVIASLAKIKRMTWQTYITMRILDKLNDPTIEFSCEQPVYDGKNYYRVDLCFPTLGLCYEIDELHHDRNKKRDEERDRKIFDALNCDDEVLDMANFDKKPIHIRIYDAIDAENDVADKKIIKIKSLEDLDKEIMDAVKNIKDAKKELGANFEVWDLEKKHSPRHQIEKINAGGLDSETHAGVRLQKHVLRFFGYTKGDFRRGAWGIKNANGENTGEYVWMPKFFKDTGTFKNSFEKDDSNRIIKIKMELIKDVSGTRDEDEKKDHEQSDKPIVFGHFKNSLGMRYYKFLGKFERCREESSRSLESTGDGYVFKLLEGGKIISYAELQKYWDDYFAQHGEYKTKKEWKDAWIKVMKSDYKADIGKMVEDRENEKMMEIGIKKNKK